MQTDEYDQLTEWEEYEKRAKFSIISAADEQRRFLLYTIKGNSVGIWRDLRFMQAVSLRLSLERLTLPGKGLVTFFDTAYVFC